MFYRHVFGNISGGFRGISRFLGISRDFAEIPEFHGSATTRNIRSPVKMYQGVFQSMQLYVIETACAQLPVLKASRNSNKLGKKIRIHQKGDLCNSLRIKLLRLEGETYNSHNKANFDGKVQTHGLLILLKILLKFRIKYRLLPIAALS